ncbi:pectinesterase [Sarracenia purpurea var. burkii]
MRLSTCSRLPSEVLKRVVIQTAKRRRSVLPRGGILPPQRDQARVLAAELVGSAPSLPLFSMAASSSSSSSSDSSSSSSQIDRRRRLRRRRTGDRDALKVRKVSHSHAKRRRRHHSSESYSSSTDDNRSNSASDSEHEAFNPTNRPKHNDIPKKKKEKDKGKGHRRKQQKHKLKEKQQDERSSGPVQLSKFLGRGKEDGVRRSAVSGKKILLKLDKSKEDKAAENKRTELLKFLNASYD